MIKLEISVLSIRMNYGHFVGMVKSTGLERQRTVVCQPDNSDFFFCWLVFSIGLFYVAQVEALEYTAGAALLIAIVFVVADRWKPLQRVLRKRPRALQENRIYRARSKSSA